MTRVAALVLAGPLLLYGQFGELSSTVDGRHLYFSSTLKFRGAEPDRGEYRIYRVIETGAIQFYAERGTLACKNSFGSGDGARTPQVSADGQTVAYTLQGVCESNQSTNAGARAELRDRNSAGALGQGTVYLSGSGKWALLVPPQGMIVASGADATLVNLMTGERSSVPPPPPNCTHPIASDGTLLVQQTVDGAGGAGPGPVATWRAGRLTPLEISGPFSVWGISDDARVVVYTSITLPGASGMPSARLMARDLKTSKDVLLSSPGANRFPWPMGISDNGRFVLYRTAGVSGPAGPAQVVNTASGQSAGIALPDRELATDGTIAGNGKVAFLVTTTGRIVRVTLASGMVETVVPATPYILNPYQFSPGSLVRLQGTLPRETERLAGRIFLGERALPVFTANEKEIAIQVPWELSNSFEAPLRVHVGSESPFQQNEIVHIPGMAPMFENRPPAQTGGLPFLAIKADWSGLLTTDPQPGEVFHTYATGLGAVQGEVETGTPTPVRPVFPIQGSIRCQFLPYTSYAETLFAGLAPGMLGIYQVTFRMPDAPAAARFAGGHCDFTSANGGGNGGVWWASMPTTAP